MITELPDLKSIDAEENKKQIRGWVAENSHVPPMFLVPFLMAKTIGNAAGVLAKVHEARRNQKEAMLRNLKSTTVILPKKQ